MEGQVHGVDVLAAEGRIHDRGRERVGDGVSGNAVDASGGVYGVDAVDAAQFLRGGLAGSGFLSWTYGGEGKDAAGTDSEDAADDTLFAHA